jgi:hypothetical protein
MSENPTPEDVRKAIEPRSDQLNADDLLTGPIVVTITGVKRGNREQPINVEIEGHKPYKPCKTMLRVLTVSYSEYAKDWVGQRLKLYCDPEVKFGGVKVGGIRISHLSGIASRRTYTLTMTKGKKAEVTVDPLDTFSAEEVKFVESTTKAIDSAKSLDDLNGYAATLKEKRKAIQDCLRPPYAKRLRILKSQEAFEPDKPETPEETLERLYSFVTRLAKCKTPAAVNTIAGDVMANDDCTESLSEVVLAMCDARIKEIGE